MIYIVEDDAAIRELEQYALQSSGYEVQSFETSEPFWQAMRTAEPELVILDVMLPGEDGFSILKKLRNTPALRRLPIIMVTAKSSELDTVRGLDCGADDYITKPFGIMEFLSRVRAALRREADRRGLALSDEVMDYLLTRFARNLKHLMGLLDRLDEFALSAKRAVTVPLLRQMLADQAEQEEKA